jgi:hypothetical protein
MCATFLLAAFAFIFFRAESISGAMLFIEKMFSNSLLTIPKIENVGKITIGSIILSVVILTIGEWVNRTAEYGFKKQSGHKFVRWLGYSIITLMILELAGQEQSFIYFQFYEYVIKMFILTIFKFFCINIMIVIAAVTAVCFIFSRASFAVPKDKNILIVGDSHTECAIDDSIFTRSFNISQSGTAYLYSYIKLRKFLAENSHIDTVLVSFHGGTMQKSMDEWTVGDKYILSHIPDYISLFQAEELSVFINNPTFYSAVVKLPVKDIRGILKFIVKHTLTYKDLYIGGYLKLDRDRLQRAIDLMENNMAAETEYSDYQIDYLLKIVNLCAEKGVELILFNAPTYNAKEYGNLQALNDFYKIYLTGTRYLDYSNFILPDYGYGDIEHLNFKGAELFSNYLENNYGAIFNN